MSLPGFLGGSVVGSLAAAGVGLGADDDTTLLLLVAVDADVGRLDEVAGAVVVTGFLAGAMVYYFLTGGAVI